MNEAEGKIWHDAYKLLGEANDRLRRALILARAHIHRDWGKTCPDSPGWKVLHQIDQVLGVLKP